MNVYILRSLTLHALPSHTTIVFRREKIKTHIWSQLSTSKVHKNLNLSLSNLIRLLYEDRCVLWMISKGEGGDMWSCFSLLVYYPHASCHFYFPTLYSWFSSTLDCYLWNIICFRWASDKTISAWRNATADLREQAEHPTPPVWPKIKRLTNK